MARTNIVANIASISLLTAYPTLPIGAGTASPTLTSNSDPLSRSTPLVDSKTMVLAYNSDVSAHTITFTSVPDSINRGGDITGYSVAAGAIALFGPFKSVGWSQAGNLLFIDVADAHVQLSVLQLP